MLKQERKNLQKAFNAGKLVGINHPDDSTYDKIKFKTMLAKIKPITTSGLISEDKELREAVKANIAMAFVDCARWYKDRRHKKSLSKTDIHAIGNEAAEYFLKQLEK